MPKKLVQVTVKHNYMFTVPDEPKTHTVEIHEGSRYIGWVGDFGSGGDVPRETEDAARAYLFDLKPELKVKAELGKKDPAPVPASPSVHD